MRRVREPFQPTIREQRHCSKPCSARSEPNRARAVRDRTVERPLRAAAGGDRGDGWSAVGRKYGVSDNAVRKWVRWYEAEREAA